MYSALLGLLVDLPLRPARQRRKRRVRVALLLFGRGRRRRGAPGRLAHLLDRRRRDLPALARGDICALGPESLGRRGGTGGVAAAGAGALTPDTLVRKASRRLKGLSLIDGGLFAILLSESMPMIDWFQGLSFFAQQTRPARSQLDRLVPNIDRGHTDEASTPRNSLSALCRAFYGKVAALLDNWL